MTSSGLANLLGLSGWLQTQCKNGDWLYLQIRPHKVATAEAIENEKFLAVGTRSLISMDDSYNCAGHVFGSSRGWLDGDSPQVLEGAEGLAIHFDSMVKRTLANDGYYRVDLSAISAGDVLVYTRNKEIQHVGIFIGLGPLREKMAISKFGPNGLYTHEIADVPWGCGELSSAWSRSRT